MNIKLNDLVRGLQKIFAIHEVFKVRRDSWAGGYHMSELLDRGVREILHACQRCARGPTCLPEVFHRSYMVARGVPEGVHALHRYVRGPTFFQAVRHKSYMFSTSLPPLDATLSYIPYRAYTTQAHHLCHPMLV